MHMDRITNVKVKFLNGKRLKRNFFKPLCLIDTNDVACCLRKCLDYINYQQTSGYIFNGASLDDLTTTF